MATDAPEPVLTDRHGFVLHSGDMVVKIADDMPFVVTTVQRIGSSPVVWLLEDGGGGVVDASLVMLSDTDAEAVERAGFCERCFNHFARDTFQTELCCESCTTPHPYSPWVKVRARMRTRAIVLYWLGLTEALMEEGGVAYERDMAEARSLDCVDD